MITELNTVIFSQALVDRLLAASDFYDRMPEFGHLKSRVDLGRTAGQALKSCRGCQQHKASYQVFTEFAKALLALPADRLQALKNYTGIAKLQYQGLNRLTGKYEVKIL